MAKMVRIEGSIRDSKRATPAEVKRMQEKAAKASKPSKKK